MQEIRLGEQILAKKYSIDEERDEFNFFTEPNDGLQIGMFRYGKNKVIQNHIHNIFSRSFNKTCEMLFVLNGRLRADIFSDEKELVQSIEVNKNEFIILLNGGHGFETLDENTIIFEAKNGPYFGVEKDKIKF